MRTFILADNQELTKAGIRYICQQVSGAYELMEVQDRKELLAALQIHPDALVFLDYTLFDLNGVDDILILKARFSKMNWILVSEQLSEDFIRRLSYTEENICIVLKESPIGEIRKAIQAALRNEPYSCGRVQQLLEQAAVQPEEKDHLLTQTEKEILKQIALGKTTKEVAAERYSSIHTIMTHRKNIFRKLAVNNVHEATKYAMRAGIIDAADYYI